MDRLIFYLFISVVYPVSLLPLRLLYVFSDFTGGFMYKILKYRRAVVRQNLQNAFPEKSPEELSKIEEDFYRNLGDLIAENVKLISISAEEVKRRCRIKNPELLEKYYAEGRTMVGAVAHYNNWELAGLSTALQAPHTFLAIYKPIKNQYFDKFMFGLRKKFGTQPVAMEKAGRAILSMNDKPTFTAFITDQTPSNTKTAYWMNFLNQDTPVFTGIERIAKKLNPVVVFCKLQRLKRGYYEIEFILLDEEPKLLPEHELTKQHTRVLEEIIRKEPANWLWSHKRWKHKRQAGEVSKLVG